MVLGGPTTSLVHMHNYSAKAIKNSNAFDETGGKVAAAVRKLLKEY